MEGHVADALELAGAIATAGGRGADAAALIGAAQALREQIGAKRQPDARSSKLSARCRMRMNFEKRA